MQLVQQTADGLVFKIVVQPRSSRNMIAGLHGDALKVKLTAPPVDGAANRMCIKFLAKCLGVPKSSLSIVSGETSRTKRISLMCPDGSASDQARQMARRIESLANG